MNQTKSTGPRTEEGKRRSSLNALKHGLDAYSPHALKAMAEQHKVDFEAILKRVTNQYRPNDEIECQLVRRIARCVWRLSIGEAMEAKLMEQRPLQSKPGIAYEKILRYERLVDIHLHRAIAALQRNRQAARPMDQPKPMAPEPEDFLSSKTNCF